MSILLQNICSLAQNHKSLELFLETNTNKPQNIPLTETWPKDYMEFGIFKLACHPPLETVNRKRRGGRVAFYISECILYHKIKELTSDEMQDLTTFFLKTVERKVF